MFHDCFTFSHSLILSLNYVLPAPLSQVAHPTNNTPHPSQPGDPKPTSMNQQTRTTPMPSQSTGMGLGLYALILIGGGLAFGAYKYLQANQEK